MELTNEQYSQISRYADGEMDAKERAFFDLLLGRDEALAAELKAYLDIQSLCASAGKKMEDRIQRETEKKNIEARVQTMVARARASWEAEHEEDKAREEHERPPAAALLSWKGYRLWAAAIAGIICVATALWLWQKKSATVPAEALMKGVNKSDPESVRRKNNGFVEQKPAIAQGDSKTSTEKEAPHDSVRTVKESVTGQKPAKPVDVARLFTAYFMPDAQPADAGKLLTEPMAFYRNKKFDNAADAFQMAKAALNVRSASAVDSRTRFYVHYYLAQTQLASGKHLAESVGELKQALKEAESEAFKNKAQWYLALAYFKTGKTNDTEALLKKLAATNGAYGQKSRQFLNDSGIK